MDNRQNPRLAYDLHIHSCLSPCGERESTPADIAGMAYVKGLDVFALTDHNTARNCPAAKIAADQYGLIFLPGMEVTTVEEIHVVCLFAELPQALAMDEFVRAKLVAIQNRPEIFGEQLILDENDAVIGEEELLLINATEISFDEIFGICEQFGGVAFPAHIDKGANSLLSNFGFIPPDSTFHTAELKFPEKYETLCQKHPYLSGCGILVNSDAHTLGDISEPEQFISAAQRSPQAVLAAIRSGIF